MRLGHRHDEITTVRRFGPISGVNARGAIKSVHHDPGIVGQSGQASCLDRRVRFDPRVADKCGFGFLGLVQFHFSRTDNRHVERGEKFAHFFQFSRVVRGNQNAVFGEFAAHAVAAFAASTNSPTPFSAKSISSFICPRENTEPSALIWTSISFLEPVMIKLPSTPASESSG